jgi:hypothetical protein
LINYIRKVIQFLLIAATWSVSSASADSFAGNQEFATLRNVYLLASIGNKDHRLRKFSKGDPIIVERACLSLVKSKCVTKALNSRFNSAIILHKRLNLKFSNEAANPDIRIIAADQNSARSKKQELSIVYAKGFHDSEDLECQLYYSLKDDSIERAVIVVSLDAPDFKQRVCYMSQLQQSLGLALLDNLPFSELWQRQPDGYSALSEDRFARLVRTFSVLSYVHMCPDLISGMDKKTVAKVLSDQACWGKLRVKPER